MSWIDTVFRSQVGWEHLEALCELGGRLAGSPGERRAAELTRDALSAAGARDARIEEFEIQGWARETSRISGDGVEIAECVALPWSPPSTARGRLVDVGAGGPDAFSEDVAGAVVMASSRQPPAADRVVHRREKYALAVDNGAVGFVFRNHLPGCLPRSGSVVGSGGGLGEIPAVGVSLETGLGLARRVEGEEVDVVVDADTGRAESWNVRAELGPETRDRVVVSCHLDGHDVSESAGDNAVGVATVVEVAAALAGRTEELDCGVEFVGFGAEEFGLIGSARYAAAEDLERIRAVVQNDGVARARDLRVVTNGFPRLGRIAERVAGRFGHPVTVVPGIELSSDHWRFVEQGVPACLVASEQPDGGGGYGSSSGVTLTPADTLDKLDVRDLRTHAILETEYVVNLTQPERLPHRSPTEVRERVTAEGKDLLADIYGWAAA